MSRAAAFFDVDGTLVGRHIVHQFIYIRGQMMPPALRSLWTAAFLMRTPYYLLLDIISRTRLNIAFYRNYAGLSGEEVKGLAQGCFENVIRPHLFNEVAECVDRHRAAGRQIVLVTGSLDFIMQPLARFIEADACLAPTLVLRDGRFTGDLDGPPVGSAEKVNRIRAYAETHGIDLSASYAYGDSIADVPMLESVGHPSVVNADRRLSDVAQRREWPALTWCCGDTA